MPVKSSPEPSSKDVILNQITKDNDVQFKWLLQSVDIQEDSHSAELLRTVVEHRWFCTNVHVVGRVQAFREKSDQRKKSLRKEIKKKSAKSSQAKKIGKDIKGTG